MTDLQNISVAWDGDLAIVTVDRQEKMNALNAEVFSELAIAFDSLRYDDKVRGVIVTGAGNKAFVAGADIGELAKMDAMGGVQTSRTGQEVFRTIERFPKPVLAAVGGYSLGGGCELALACHVRIASENARFGLPEVGLGIIPGYGATVRLARVVGLGRAVEMALTGEMIDAQAALGMGLVTHVVPRDELMDRGKEILAKITKNGPLAIQMVLESIYRGMDTTLAEATGFESTAFGLLASTEDVKEGMTAFLEKRRPEFKGR
ncbi:MAG: enoyl-CoA hydratase-related protein [Gemmatimonadota bacterium]|jgi:enoyl-CoA hydratase